MSVHLLQKMDRTNPMDFFATQKIGLHVGNGELLCIGNIYPFATQTNGELIPWNAPYE